MPTGELSLTIVNACLRAGAGGSPTAVLADPGLSDRERRRVPVLAGTSHAVFVSPDPLGVSLRFFTAEGELPACGHGTVAALAFLAERAGEARYQTVLRTPGRVFTGWAERAGSDFTAGFDPGPVELREATPAERQAVEPALGTAVTDARVASVGRPRLLVPVPTRPALAALAPDLDQLRSACDRFGLLGCYVYSPPAPDGRLAARMFAPSIGVPEDIANANSTACLAAHLAGQGITAISVDMGDSLGSPATITATGHPELTIGGAAVIAGPR